MNTPKCDLSLYSRFLLTSQQRFSCAELARVTVQQTSHDAVSNFLQRERLAPKHLWDEVQTLIRDGGLLIVDDTVFAKPSSRKNSLLHYLWDNVDKKIVRGIGLTTLLWTSAAGEHVPIDFRIYGKNLDGKTKNDHLQEMVVAARHRNVAATHMLIDAWYTSVANLACLRSKRYRWIGQLRKNRVVFYRQERLHLEDLPVGQDTWQVYLKNYGSIKVCRVTRADASIVYLGTNDLTLSKEAAQTLFRLRWRVEEYHQSLKQQAAAGKCASHTIRGQRNHLFSAIRTFLGLERYRLLTGTPYPEAKQALLREAIADRLAEEHPLFNLLP